MNIGTYQELLKTYNELVGKKHVILLNEEGWICLVFERENIILDTVLIGTTEQEFQDKINHEISLIQKVKNRNASQAEGIKAMFGENEW